MNRNTPLSRWNIFFLALLYLSSRYDFLVFHILAEFFSIVIAFAIFAIAWNTRHIQHNGYFLFLGIAYLFVGFLDLVHTQTYKGMTVIRALDADTPTQLWIIARYLQTT